MTRAAYAREMMAHYMALDRALVAHGWPATSPWWLSIVQRYFESDCKQVVLRVGRRGGKSSTFCRVATIEVLYGKHDVPPGDTGFAAFISENRTEAAERLSTIKKILDALSIGYRPIDGGVILRGRNRGFRVYAARIAGVSGFTALCVFCDEVSKWKDADTGVNPATEVLASLRPTMATMPLAKMILSSSPMGHLDAHAEAFNAGDSEFQFARHAPTWVANPTLTEGDTRRLEPSASKWRREYAAEPLEGTEEGLLSPEMLDASTRPAGIAADLPREAGVTYTASMDPGFTRNAWTFAITARRYVGSALKRSVVLVREWRGTPERPNDPKAVLREIAALCRTYGIDTVYTDQYERFGLGAIATDPAIDLHIIVPEWSAVQRLAAYESLELWAVNGELDIPAHKVLRADLLSIRRKLTENGFTIKLPETPDGRHADYAPTVSMGLAKAVVEPPAPRAEVMHGTEQYWANEERETMEYVDREVAQGHDPDQAWAALGL